MGSARCSAKSTWGRRSQLRPSSRLSPRKQSRTSSESLLVCGEPREEAPRVLVQFLLLLLDHSLPRNPRHFVQAGWRVRGDAWPSGLSALGEGDYMYSTSLSQKK